MPIVIELPGGCTPIPSDIWGGAPQEYYEISYRQLSGVITPEEAWEEICNLPKEQGPPPPLKNDDINRLVKSGYLQAARRLLAAYPHEMPFDHWELLPPPTTERVG